MSELERCMAALEAIGTRIVRKSTRYQEASPKVAKAIAISRGSSTPEGAILAKRIIQLEQQEVLRKSFAPVIKSMGLSVTDDDDDWWSRQFSKADDNENDLVEELREIRQREAEILAAIRGGRED